MQSRLLSGKRHKASRSVKRPDDQRENGYCYLALFEALNGSGARAFDISRIKRELGPFPLAKVVAAKLYSRATHDIMIPNVFLVSPGLYHVDKKQRPIYLSALLLAVLGSDSRIGGEKVTDEDVTYSKAISALRNICDVGNFNINDSIAEAARKQLATALSAPDSVIKDVFAPRLVSKTHFKVPYALNVAEITHLQEEYPELSVITGNSAHPHAYAANALACAEELILRQLKYNKKQTPSAGDDVVLVDIGANYHRHAINERWNVHCCTPIIDIRDSSRETTRSLTLQEAVEKGTLSRDRCKAYVSSPGSLLRCFNRGEDCYVKGRSAMMIHSQYDISLQTLGCILDAHEPTILMSVVNFVPAIMYAKSGTSGHLGMNWRKADGNIYFEFVSDSSMGYSHPEKQFISTVTAQAVVTPNGRLYLCERFFRGSALFLKYVYCQRKPETMRLRAEFSLWDSCATDTVILMAWEYDMRRFAESKFRTSKHPHVRFTKKFIVIPARFFQMLYSHCIRSGDKSFNFNEVFSAACTYNSKLCVNGNDIRCTNFLTPEELIFAVVVIYCIAYRDRYQAGKTIETFVGSEKDRRNARRVGLTNIFGAAWRVITEGMGIIEKFCECWNRLVDKMADIYASSDLDVKMLEAVRCVTVSELMDVSAKFEEGFEVVKDPRVNAVSIQVDHDGLLQSVVEVVREKYGLKDGETPESKPIVVCKPRGSTSKSSSTSTSSSSASSSSSQTDGTTDSTSTSGVVSDVPDPSDPLAGVNISFGSGKTSKNDARRIKNAFHLAHSKKNENNSRVLRELRSSEYECKADLLKVEVPMDGNCLYHTLAHFAGTTQVNMRHMMHNASEAVDPSILCMDGSRKAWGSTDVITSFSRMYNVRICVHMVNGDTVVPTPLYTHEEVSPDAPLLHIHWYYSGAFHSDKYVAHASPMVPKVGQLPLLWPRMFEVTRAMPHLATDEYLGFEDRQELKLMSLLENLGNVSGLSVLELGAAPGAWTAELSPHVLQTGGSYTAVTAPNGLQYQQRYAQHIAPEVHMVEGDANAYLATPPQQYDLILSDVADADSWQSNTAQARLMTLALTCLRPGGSLIVKFSNVFDATTDSAIDLLPDCFGEVLLTKPTGSRERNSEFYVVATQYGKQCSFSPTPAREVLRDRVMKYCAHLQAGRPSSCPNYADILQAARTVVFSGPLFPETNKDSENDELEAPALPSEPQQMTLEWTNSNYDQIVFDCDTASVISDALQPTTSKTSLGTTASLEWDNFSLSLDHAECASQPDDTLLTEEDELVPEVVESLTEESKRAPGPREKTPVDDTPDKPVAVPTASPPVPVGILLPQLRRLVGALGNTQAPTTNWEALADWLKRTYPQGDMCERVLELGVYEHRRDYELDDLLSKFPKRSVAFVGDRQLPPVLADKLVPVLEADVVVYDEMPSSLPEPRPNTCVFRVTNPDCIPQEFHGYAHISAIRCLFTSYTDFSVNVVCSSQPDNRPLWLTTMTRALQHAVSGKTAAPVEVVRHMMRGLKAGGALEKIGTLKACADHMDPRPEGCDACVYVSTGKVTPSLVSMVMGCLREKLLPLRSNAIVHAFRADDAPLAEGVKKWSEYTMKRNGAGIVDGKVVDDSPSFPDKVASFLNPLGNYAFSRKVVEPGTLRMYDTAKSQVITTETYGVKSQMSLSFRGNTRRATNATDGAKEVAASTGTVRRTHLATYSVQPERKVRDVATSMTHGAEVIADGEYSPHFRVMPVVTKTSCTQTHTLRSVLPDFGLSRLPCSKQEIELGPCKGLKKYDSMDSASQCHAAKDPDEPSQDPDSTAVVPRAAPKRTAVQLLAEMARQLSLTACTRGGSVTNADANGAADPALLAEVAALLAEENPAPSAPSDSSGETSETSSSVSAASLCTVISATGPVPTAKPKQSVPVEVAVEALDASERRSEASSSASVVTVIEVKPPAKPAEKPASPSKAQAAGGEEPPTPALRRKGSIASVVSAFKSSLSTGKKEKATVVPLELAALRDLLPVGQPPDELVCTSNHAAYPHDCEIYVALSFANGPKIIPPTGLQNRLGKEVWNKQRLLAKNFVPTESSTTWSGYYRKLRTHDLIVLIEGKDHEAQLRRFMEWLPPQVKRVAIESAVDLSETLYAEILRSVGQRVTLVDSRGREWRTVRVLTESPCNVTLPTPAPIAFPKLTSEEMGYIRNPPRIKDDSHLSRYRNAMLEFKHITAHADNFNKTVYRKYGLSSKNGPAPGLLEKMVRSGRNVFDQEQKQFLVASLRQKYSHAYSPSKDEYVAWNEKTQKFKSTDRYLIVGRETEMMLNARILETIAPIEIYSQILPEIEWINGPPGCGKTHTIVQTTSISPTAGVGKDLVLSMTREGKESIKAAVKAKNNSLDTAALNAHVRTVASLLVNGTSLTYERVLVDEALMAHAGTLGFITALTKTKRLLIIGDIHQIPFVDRLHMCELKYYKPDVFASISSKKEITYRCPIDVTYALSSLYTNFSTKSTVAVSMHRRSFSREAAGMRKDVPDCLYLVHFQADKDKLVREKYGTGKGSRVLTIHEAQGLTFKHVVCIRTNPKPLDLYHREEYGIVAISRHTQSFDYYTDTDDVITRLIRRGSGLGQTALLVWNEPRLRAAQAREKKGLPQLTAGGIIAEAEAYVRLMEREEDPSLVVGLPAATHAPLEYVAPQRLSSAYHTKPPKYKGNFEEDVAYLQSFYDSVMPCVAQTEYKHDQLLMEASDTYLFCSEVTIHPLKGLYQLPKFGKLRPRMRTIMQAKKIPSQKESMLGAIKRNLNAPDLVNPNLIAEELGDRLFENFIRSGIDKSKEHLVYEYQRDPITVSSRLVSAWLDNQPPGRRAQIVSDLPLHLRPYNSFNYMVKSDVKPQLSPSAQFQYPSVQTIVYNDPSVNAIFCPIYNILFDRLMSVLHPKILLFTGMSPPEYEVEVNARLHASVMQKCQAIENDFSKYDKAQQAALRRLERRLWEHVGLDPELSQIWDDSRRKSNVRDRKNGVEFRTTYQRKSGEATTFSGNTMVAVCVMLAVVDIDDVALLLAAGDDSLIYLRPGAMFLDSSRLIADLFNLECKLLDRYHVPYFCSKFLVTTDEWTYLVHDPLKFVTKLGRLDMTNFYHVEEYRVSCIDTMKSLFNPVVSPRLSLGVQERYGGTFSDLSKVLNVLRSLCMSPEKFAALFVHDRGVTLCTSKNIGKLN